MPLNFPSNNLPLSRPQVSRAQNTSVSRLQQHTDRENAAVSMNQLNKRKTSAAVSMNSLNTPKAPLGIGGETKEEERARDNRRYAHIRKLMIEKQKKEGK